MTIPYVGNGREILHHYESYAAQAPRHVPLWHRTVVQQSLIVLFHPLDVNYFGSAREFAMEPIRYSPLTLLSERTKQYNEHRYQDVTFSSLLVYLIHGVKWLSHVLHCMLRVALTTPFLVPSCKCLSDVSWRMNDDDSALYIPWWSLPYLPQTFDPIIIPM